MATTKLHSLRRHLRSNAVAYIAVFIALGGTPTGPYGHAA